MSKQALSTVATRHQVMLERLKAQVSRDFTKVLPEIEKAIRDVVFELQVDTMNSLSAKRLKTLLEELRFVQTELIAGAKENLLDDLRGLSKYEAGFEQRSIQAAVDAAKKGSDLHGYETSATPAKDAFQEALKKPMSATGQLLEPFVDNWGAKQLDGVEQAVQRAWSEGRTVQQLVTEIRGTKAGGYKDGLVEASRRQAEAVARTATQHVAQSARQAVWERNSDLVEGVIFVATLDSKTTTQCRSLDGKEFPLDSGPRPPLHINCRSTTIAKLPKELDFLDKDATRSSLNGYVPAKQTYYEWLGTQPAAFQNEALGVERATLFREGGLSADEFARLNLDRNFEPLTLAEMAAKEPTAFENAGLDEYVKPDDQKEEKDELVVEKPLRTQQELTNDMYSRLKDIAPGENSQPEQMANDPDLKALLERSETFGGKNKLEVFGASGECHWNTGKLWERGKVDHIVIGYTRDPRGVWFQHTWGLKNGKVVETTSLNSINTHYFGTKLTKAEADAFSERLKTYKPGMGMIRTIKGGSVLSPDDGG